MDPAVEDAIESEADEPQTRAVIFHLISQFQTYCVNYCLFQILGNFGRSWIVFGVTLGKFEICHWSPCAVAALV